MRLLFSNLPLIYDPWLHYLTTVLFISQEKPRPMLLKTDLINPRKKRKQTQTPEIKTKNSKPTLDRVHHDTDPSSPNTATRRPQELSARRVKVMQSLGLVAPLGSPFPRNQVVPANPTVLN
ncbi:hypothetical protein Hanom_Chr06g00568441 [Helianthus anomalus]